MVTFRNTNGKYSPAPMANDTLIPVVASAPRRIVAPAPLWTLDGLRAADLVLGLALLMLVAILLAEALHRTAHPAHLRPCSPARWPARDAAHLPGLELTIRGSRSSISPSARCCSSWARGLRPRWLLDNRWLALSVLLQAALLAPACSSPLALGWLGAPWLTAVVAGTVAASTSPVIVLAVSHGRARAPGHRAHADDVGLQRRGGGGRAQVLRIVLASDSGSRPKFTRASISACA